MIGDYSWLDAMSQSYMSRIPRNVLRLVAGGLGTHFRDLRTPGVSVASDLRDRALNMLRLDVTTSADPWGALDISSTPSATPTAASDASEPPAATLDGASHQDARNSFFPNS